MHEWVPERMKSYKKVRFWKDILLYIPKEKFILAGGWLQPHFHVETYSYIFQRRSLYLPEALAEDLAEECKVFSRFTRDRTMKVRKHKWFEFLNISCGSSRARSHLPFFLSRQWATQWHGRSLFFFLVFPNFERRVSIHIVYTRYITVAIYFN